MAGAETRRETYDTWYRAVKDHTVRDATHDEDKLPAISAIARNFAELLQDDYLAGIWRGDLLRGLLWSTYPTLDFT